MQHKKMNNNYVIYILHVLADPNNIYGDILIMQLLRI